MGFGIVELVSTKQRLITAVQFIRNKNKFKYYLRSSEQTDFVRKKYNIDSFHNHKYHYFGNNSNAGFFTVKLCLVYPSFEEHFRFFAREMMRLSGSSSLLWLTTYKHKWVY